MNRNLNLPVTEEEMYHEEKRENHDGRELDSDTDSLVRHNSCFWTRQQLWRSRKVEETSGWELCTVTQVEEVKILIRMVPVFLSTILMNTCLAQLQTFSVQQGTTMDKKLGSLDIRPASLPIIPMTFIIILTPIYDRVFDPFARRTTGLETGITHLQRLGVGLVLSIFSMVAAAIVDIKRKDVAEEQNLVLANAMINQLLMSVFTLSFQYFIFEIADLFTFVGRLEFFYSKAPRSFRSLGTAFSLCSMAMGYFMS